MSFLLNSGPPDRVTRVDSAGVELIVDAGDDTPLSWTVVPEFALGGEAEGPEGFYRVSAEPG